MFSRPLLKTLDVWLHRIMGAAAVLGGIYGFATDVMDGGSFLSRLLSAGSAAFGGALVVSLTLQLPLIAAEHAVEQESPMLQGAAFVWMLAVLVVMLDFMFTGGFFTIWPLGNAIFGTDFLAFPYGHGSL